MKLKMLNLVILIAIIAGILGYRFLNIHTKQEHPINKETTKVAIHPFNIIEYKNSATDNYSMKKLMFGNKVLIAGQINFDIESQSFIIDGKNTYIVSYWSGGNCDECSGTQIIQITSNKESAIVSEEIARGISTKDVTQHGNSLIFEGPGNYNNTVFQNGTFKIEEIKMPDRLFSVTDIESGGLTLADLYHQNSNFRNKVNTSLQKKGISLWWFPDRLNSKLETIETENDSFLAGSVCEPHNCPHSVKILYSQKSNKLIGIYVNKDKSNGWEGEKFTLFGDKPTDAELSFLETQIYQSISDIPVKDINFYSQNCGAAFTKQNSSNCYQIVKKFAYINISESQIEIAEALNRRPHVDEKWSNIQCTIDKSLISGIIDEMKGYGINYQENQNYTKEDKYSTLDLLLIEKLIKDFNDKSINLGYFNGAQDVFNIAKWCKSHKYRGL